MIRKLFSLGVIAAVLLGLTGCRHRYSVSGGTEFNLDNSGEEDKGPEPKQENPEPKTQPPKPEQHQHYDLLSPEVPYTGEGNSVDGHFFDDFNSYDGTFYQGQDFGPWTAVYDGEGFIRVEAHSNEGAWLELQPALPGVPDTLAELIDEIRDSMSEEESRALTTERLEKLIEARVTRSALVVGPEVTAPFVYRSVLTTEYQTKEDPASKFDTTDEALLQKLEPNTWEVAWVIWNYIPDPHGNYDRDSFDYFMLKTNGWELGKRNALGQQDIIITGDDVKLCTEGEEDCNGPYFRDVYEVIVEHDFFNAITVYVDGQKVVRYQSDDNGVAFGRVGIYDEDAGISVAEVEVRECGKDDPLCEDTLEAFFPVE
jgi:hypothetical protein